MARLNTKKAEGQNSAVAAGLGYTIGNILIKGISFLAIPICSRLLSQEDYGLYNTFLSYASILAIFISLALNASIKNAKYDFQDRLNAYASSLILLMLFNAAIVLVLGLVVSPMLSGVAALGGGMVILLVAESFGNAMLTFYNAALAIEFRYKEYLCLSVFYSVGSILLSVVLITQVLPGNGYLARTLGSVVPLLLLSVYILVRLFQQARPAVSKTYWTYGLKFSLPLIPHSLSQILLSQFDRIMILHSIGEAEAGIYSFAYNIAIIYQVLTTSMDTAWTPWFYEQMAAGKEDSIRKNTALYIALMSVVAVLMMLVCPEIIWIMGGRKYLASRYVVIPIVLAMYFSFLYMMPAAVEYYHKKTNLIAIGTVCAAVINVILNLIFISLYGYIAAAYTTVACYVLYFIFHLILSHKIMGRFVFDMKAMFLCLLFVVAFAVLSLVFVDWMVVRWGIILVFVVAFGIAAVRKRDEWKRFILGIIKK